MKRRNVKCFILEKEFISKVSLQKKIAFSSETTQGKEV